MDAAMATSLGKCGAMAVVTLAAVGSAMGTGVAAMAAIGAWKKCFAQNRTAPFMMVAFIGAPLSQTIYGMILMNRIIAAAQSNPMSYPALLVAGVVGGFAMGLSAYLQGCAGASAADAFGETGKGFGNCLMALGIIETVAIFVMVFLLMSVGK